MNDMSAHGAFHHAIQAADPAREAIGYVAEIAGSRSEVVFDVAALNALAGHPDPVVATAGQVGG